MKTLILSALLICSLNLFSQDTVVVTKTTDPDPFLYPYDNNDSLCSPEMKGTLQWAFRKALDFGNDIVYIIFNIPGAEQHVISLNYALPQLNRKVFIDGTSQPGYQNGTPSIIIDGNGNINIGISLYSVDSCVITGLCLRNFRYNGILCNRVNNSQFIGNDIYNITRMLYDLLLGEGEIGLLSSSNNVIKGSIIGTDNSGNSYINRYAGINIQKIPSDRIATPPSYGNIIGSVNTEEGNIIANNTYYGILIGQDCYSNPISGNMIYNNNKGIFLTQATFPHTSGNYGKTAPEITSFVGDSVSGVSEPGDIIEIFGSTGNENTNKYLGTTQADSVGNWLTAVNTTYEYVVASATDLSNNTSNFSTTFQIIKTQLVNLPYKIYQTGKIYLKIKNNSNVELLNYPNILQDTNNIILPIMQHYGVTLIEKPFVAFNTPTFDRIYRITFTDTINVEMFINDLKNVNFVEYSEKIPFVYEQISPDDQYIGTQYFLNNINAFGAFDIFNTVPGTENTIVAIVDDAVYIDHNDLHDNTIYCSHIDMTYTNSNFNDPNPPFYNNTVDVHNFSHGTHVAGIAGGVTNNSIGIASIGWSNNLMCIKTRKNESNDLSLPECYTGVTWAATHGARVINMSWGSTAFSQAEYTVILQAKSLDVVLVAAAGNYANSIPYYPAAYGEGTTTGIGEVLDRKLVIAVAALDQNNDISNWGTGGFGAPAGSNYGNWVDISAYGTGIRSTVAKSENGGAVNDLYEYYDGTSMAAPMVSGTAGLMRTYKNTDNADEIYDCLVFTANQDIYSEQHPNNYYQLLGHGRLDAKAALQCLGVDCAYGPFAVISASSQTICTDGNVILTANNGISYLWSTGETTQSINVYSSGQYAVTVTFAGGCTSSNTINITPASTTPTIYISENSGVNLNDGILCGQDFLYLTTSYGSSYQWNNFNATSSCIGPINAGLNVPFTQTYIVTVTDVDGCVGVVGTAQVTAQWIEAPTVSISEINSLCNGACTTLTAVTNLGNWSYLWNTGDTTPSIVVCPTSNATYSVTVSAPNGCTDVDDEFFLVLPSPIVNAGADQTVCEGDIVTLNASGGDFYVWDNGVVNGVGFTPPVGTTVYTVIGFESNGVCSNTDQVTVTVNPTITPLFTALGPYCAGSVPDILPTTSSNGVTGTWSPSAISTTTAGTTTYNFTPNANECATLASLIITVNPLPTPVITGVLHYCAGSNTTLDAGSGYSSYLWSTNATSQTITVTTVNNPITVTVTDANGCIGNSLSVNITENPLPLVNAGSDITVCSGTSVTLLGSGADSYTWDNGVIDGIPFTPLLTTSYTVTGTDINGCTSTDQVIVTIQSSLTASFITTQPSCYGINDASIEVTNITGTPNYSFLWSNAQTTQLISNLSPGTYSVVVTDANGCTWTGSDIIIDDNTNSQWPWIMDNTSGNQAVYDMVYAPDATGESFIYTIGLAEGNATIGGVTYPYMPPNPPYYYKYIYVSKIDYCGNEVAGKAYGIAVDAVFSHNSTRFHRYQIDKLANGKIAIAGDFFQAGFTGSGFLPCANGFDFFLAFIDPNTLYCSSVNDEMCFTNSSSAGYILGLSTENNSAAITGYFAGGSINFPNNVPPSNFVINNANTNSTDLFIARYDYTTSPIRKWATKIFINGAYDMGFNMKYISPNIYFTSMDQTGGVYRSYLWKLNPANGAALDVKQIGTGANYFAVTDMTKGLNGQLYLCGYNQATYTNTASRKAFICKYETPSTPTGIDWSNAVVNLSTSSNQYNYASKLAVNTNDGSVLISGTFGISSYLFGGSTYLSLGGGSGTLYNHFAARFNPTPTQLNLVWQTGLGDHQVSANASGGNSMVYDSHHNMFYIGGAFKGQLGLNQQGYFTANSGADAFVARFEDLGEAYYKDFQIQNPFIVNNNLKFKVYPNPSKGIFNVSVSDDEIIKKIEVNDLLGQQVYIIEKTSENEAVVIDISQLTGNTFILTVTTENEVYSAKLFLIK